MRAACALMVCLFVSPAAIADDLPLVFEDDFESSLLSTWRATDPTAWAIEHPERGAVLSQHRASVVQTPVRSPFNRIVVDGLNVTDFQLDVDVHSTCIDYGHRDMCLFFGYQDPAHFYYVHLGKQADDNANQIFIVNEAPRTKISLSTTTGTPWDDEWHHVRITRDVDSGRIEVFFDDLDTPAMTAEDRTFTSGTVGLGTFDDTGRFDNFQLLGTIVE